MKLNLGCGYNKIDGYVNVDMFNACDPDELVNLNVTPWPWETSSVESIVMIHSLEHIGQQTETFLNIMSEMYRVCKNDAVIQIAVPHWLHQNFAHDPTHCRVITPIGMAMFGKQRNLNDLANGGSESKLGLLLNVDFEVVNVEYMPDGFWFEKSQAEQWSEEQIARAITDQPGACQEIRIAMKVIKPE